MCLLFALIVALYLSVVAAQITFTAQPQPPWAPRILQGFAFPSQTVRYTINNTGSTATAAPGVNTIVAWGGSAKSSPSTRPQTFNDVYISTDGAQTWKLIGGQAATVPAGMSLNVSLNGNAYVFSNATNTTGALIAAQPFYADDADSCKFYDKASNTYFVFDTVNAYTSTDALTWTSASNSEYLGHMDSLCYTDNAARVYIISGSDGLNGNYQNDVWSSTVNNIQSWNAASAYAPWAQRDSMSGFSTVSQGVSLLYAMGGHDKPDNLRSNQVWVSANAGVNWTLIANATWTGRDHASSAAIVTPTNVIMIFGGKLNATDPVTGNNLCVNDIWASLDGGLTWGSCGNGTWQPRQDHTAVLSPDGYVYVSGGWQNKTVYWSDMWKSNQNVSNPATVASLCGLSVPSAGVGLTNFAGIIGANPSATTASSSSSSSAGNSGSNSSVISSTGNSAHSAATFSLLLLCLSAALTFVLTQ